LLRTALLCKFCSPAPTRWKFGKRFPTESPVLSVLSFEENPVPAQAKSVQMSALRRYTEKSPRNQELWQSIAPPHPLTKLGRLFMNKRIVHLLAGHPCLGAGIISSNTALCAGRSGAGRDCTARTATAAGAAAGQASQAADPQAQSHFGCPDFLGTIVNRVTSMCCRYRQWQHVRHRPPDLAKQHEGKKVACGRPRPEREDDHVK